MLQMVDSGLAPDLHHELALPQNAPEQALCVGELVHTLQANLFAAAHNNA